MAAGQRAWPKYISSQIAPSSVNVLDEVSPYLFRCSIVRSPVKRR